MQDQQQNTLGQIEPREDTAVSQAGEDPHGPGGGIVEQGFECRNSGPRLGIIDESLARQSRSQLRRQAFAGSGLGQVGRALVGSLGVGEPVRGLPDPGPDDLEQGVDRRPVASLGPDDQVSETVGGIHAPDYGDTVAAAVTEK